MGSTPVAGVDLPPDHSSIRSFKSVLSVNTPTPATLFQPQQKTTFSKHGLHKGFPSVFYTSNQVQQYSQSFQWTLIGKFPQGYNKENPTLGRPPMENLQKYFTSLDLKGDFQIGLMDNRHLMIRLCLQQDFIHLYSRPLWYVGNVTMRVFKWSPGFHVEKESSIVPVWISFPRLPLHLFHQEALFSLASLIGTPLRMDQATQSLKRPSIARVQLELDLLKDRPEKIWIEMEGFEGFWQRVAYENIPPYCQHCWHVGHSEEACHVSHPELKITEKQSTMKSHPNPSSKIQWIPKIQHKGTSMDVEVSYRSRAPPSGDKFTEAVAVGDSSEVIATLSGDKLIEAVAVGDTSVVAKESDIPTETLAQEKQPLVLTVKDHVSTSFSAKENSAGVQERTTTLQDQPDLVKELPPPQVASAEKNSDGVVPISFQEQQQLLVIVPSPQLSCSTDYAKDLPQREDEVLPSSQPLLTLEYHPDIEENNDSQLATEVQQNVTVEATYIAHAARDSPTEDALVSTPVLLPSPNAAVVQSTLNPQAPPFLSPTPSEAYCSQMTGKSAAYFPPRNIEEIVADLPPNQSSLNVELGKTVPISVSEPAPSPAITSAFRIKDIVSSSEQSFQQVPLIQVPFVGQQDQQVTTSAQPLQLHQQQTGSSNQSPALPDNSPTSEEIIDPPTAVSEAQPSLNEPPLDKGKQQIGASSHTRSYQDILQTPSPLATRSPLVFQGNQDGIHFVRPTVNQGFTQYDDYDPDYHFSGSEDEYDDYENFLDSEHIRNDDYLEHRRLTRARQSRRHLDSQFRRGRGRPPGSRRTYFDVIRTISTRAHTVD